MNNNDSQDQENDNESKTSNESQNSVAAPVSKQYGITLQQKSRLVLAPVGTANNNDLAAPIVNTEQSNAPKVHIRKVERNLNNPSDVKMTDTLYTLPEDTTEAEITPRGTIRFKRRRTSK